MRTRLKPESSGISSGGVVASENGGQEGHLDTIADANVPAPAVSSKVDASEIPEIQDITMTFVPIAAVCVLVFILGMGTWSCRKRICVIRKCKEHSVSNSKLFNKIL